MLLACIVSMSLVASSAKMSEAEISSTSPPAYLGQEDAAEMQAASSPEDTFYEGGEEGLGGSRVVRRAARRRCPEESDRMEIAHRQVSIPISETECSCPEVMAKGTLIAIVATLAFLGFFSTSVLVVVAVCILRVVERQRKKGKEASAPTKRARPPVPPPCPEHMYMTVKACTGYQRLHPVSPCAKEGVYLNANELQPGPRIYQERHYPNVTEPAPRSTPENEYIPPETGQPFSTLPTASKYSNVDEPQPEPGAYQERRYQNVRAPARRAEGSPSGGMSPRREPHNYEEVE